MPDPARTRGQALAQRVRARTRNASRATEVLSGLMLLVFAAIAAFAALTWLPFVHRVASTPSATALALVLGGLALRWNRVANLSSTQVTLWRARRRTPIRRRTWLRWVRRGAPQQCGYCHDALEASEPTCPDCGAAFHADCLAELGECATLGCAGLGIALRERVSLRDPAQLKA